LFSRSVLAAIIIIVAACIPIRASDYHSRTLTPPDNAVPAEVLRVVDGDTLLLRINGREERLRYIGVDTPETVHPSKEVQAFGKEAYAANRALVEGVDVLIEFDVEPRDMYGRLLGYVYLSSGGMVNAILIELGYAALSTWPPNVRYVELLRELQRAAICEERGLWEVAEAECEPPAPEECEPGTVAVNSASLERLQTLPGIGATLAQRIIASRPFSDAHDLTRVSGIGAATTERLRPLLCFAP